MPDHRSQWRDASAACNEEESPFGRRVGKHEGPRWSAHRYARATAQRFEIVAPAPVAIDLDQKLEYRICPRLFRSWGYQVGDALAWTLGAQRRDLAGAIRERRTVQVDGDNAG